MQVSVNEGQLALGRGDVSCRNMPFPAAAIAQINLLIPENHQYALFINGVINTHDETPTANDVNFDAFEVHIDRQVNRIPTPFGGQLSCDNLRIIDINSTEGNNRFPLSQFSGETEISLQNHSRFDEFYNTYTHINMIWIDE